MNKISSLYLPSTAYDDAGKAKVNLEGVVIGNGECAYKIGKVIGSGTFGELRYCLCLNTNQMLAVKIEPNEAEIPQLKREYEIYSKLRDEISANEIIEGIPQVYYFGSCGDRHKALVMDLLGPSLQDLFQYCNKRFSLKTVLMIAVQLISRLEYIHYYGLVYRDIKPENFLIGKRSNGTEGIIWIVDFGLAKDYLDKQGKHIRFREQKPLTGTARYMSVNTHFGVEQSRRDDIEGLAYMFLYFLKGSLPWQGLKLIKTESSKQKYRKIAEMKRDMSPNELCDGWPDEFKILLRYARGLDFIETPDYSYLRQLFEQLLYFYGWDMDNVYDWTGRLPPSPEDSISGASLCKRPLIGFRDQFMQQRIDIIPKPIFSEDGSSPANEGAAKSFDIVWPHRDPNFFLPQNPDTRPCMTNEGIERDNMVNENNYRDCFNKKEAINELTSTKRVFCDKHDNGGLTDPLKVESEGQIRNERVTFSDVPEVRKEQNEQKTGFFSKLCNCCS